MKSSPVRVRLIHPADAPHLCSLLSADAEDLRYWDPPRPDGYYTIAFQQRRVEDVLVNHAAGTQWPGVITTDEEVIGTINLHNVLRGPFQSAFVGYWVATPFRGQGAATRALALTLDIARQDLDLHRLGPPASLARSMAAGPCAGTAAAGAVVAVLVVGASSTPAHENDRVNQHNHAGDSGVHRAWAACAPVYNSAPRSPVMHTYQRAASIGRACAVRGSARDGR